MLDDLSKYQELAEESGFYTAKAREIDNGGLKERYEFLKDLKERFDEREDFNASEENLKLDI